MVQKIFTKEGDKWAAINGHIPSTGNGYRFEYLKVTVVAQIYTCAAFVLVLKRNFRIFFKSKDLRNGTYMRENSWA